MCGDLAQARLFRNKVNRAAVRLRKEFYQAKVATLSESSTREWWRHMKSLMGTTSNNDAEMQGLANNLCEGNIEVLANRINEFLVSVSSNLPRLTNDLRERERQVYLQPDGLDSNTYNTYNINIIKYLQYGRHTGTTNICLLPIVQSPWY